MEMDQEEAMTEALLFQLKHCLRKLQVDTRTHIKHDSSINLFILSKLSPFGLLARVNTFG